MSSNSTIVFFDLETTGLDTSVCHITQLSAVSGERLFNVYTFPPAPSLRAPNGLQASPPILLAAHNAKGFDAPILTRVLLQNHLLQEFQQVVSGFLDTLQLSKWLHPDLPGQSQPFLESQSVVFFDLETTGLGQTCDIVQLAAVSGGHSLNLYVLPRCRMERGAARVTGFRVRRQRLYLHRQVVLTNSLREVLVSFMAFLRMLGRPLVIGHNIRRFDCRVLSRALDELDLRAGFNSSISGCVDTLPLAREVLRDRCLKSFRQESLVKELLGVTYKAHDALEDVRALQALYSVLQPPPELVCRHMFTLETMARKAGVKAAKLKFPARCQYSAPCGST
ncbi:unnamed protein product [Pleuronectes platessa]|uniref:exodeoxyribonuclease III n=1 Tax=Pleuronectes platessa TaxID=8262 RepID=A0A9N7VM79_PLEPL|nr:unnamed protein product [Pleuronectes platessa]